MGQPLMTFKEFLVKGEGFIGGTDDLDPGLQYHVAALS